MRDINKIIEEELLIKKNINYIKDNNDPIRALSIVIEKRLSSEDITPLKGDFYDELRSAFEITLLSNQSLAPELSEKATTIAEQRRNSYEEFGKVGKTSDKTVDVINTIDCTKALSIINNYYTINDKKTKKPSP